ncbi:MAG: fructosamine kinase family protein [Microcystaceae cyanobacterium]
MWTQIAQQIAQVTQTDFIVENYRSVSGGCINQGYSLTGLGKTYFVKVNDPSQVEMFAAEALGLKQIFATNTIRVPKPICSGATERFSYIVLEWVELGRSQKNSWQEMGKQLAQMHKIDLVSQFGWDRNNTIGSTPQLNPWADNWADFFAESRIGYQLNLAKRRGGNFIDIGNFVEVVRDSLKERKPHPSLVHGDLWSGNASLTQKGEPIIFDPATYYGDHEVDLAMTELFGGFSSQFYQGYESVFPLDQGYSKRKVLYNLYHILNHFNLFGGGYESQALRMMKQVERI